MLVWVIKQSLTPTGKMIFFKGEIIDEDWNDEGSEFLVFNEFTSEPELCQRFEIFRDHKQLWDNLREMILDLRDISSRMLSEPLPPSL